MLGQTAGREPAAALAQVGEAHQGIDQVASVAERRERELRLALSRAGVDCLELATDGDLVDALMRFADLRKRRSRLAGGGGLHTARGVLPVHLEKVA